MRRRGVAGLLVAAAALAAMGVVMAGLASAAVAHPGRHPAPPVDRQVQRIRTATAQFHNIATAEAAGYVPFQDTAGISCIEMADMADMGMGSMGGMGVHYVKPSLIADPAIDPTAPEALVYAPERDGTLRLAALEYLVDKKAWDAGHRHGPRLFAHRPFDVTEAPNRYGLDTFYAQHVWAWKTNRSGLTAMWNPAVHCEWA